MTKITIIDDLHPEDNAMLQALQSRSPARVDERLEKLKDRDVGSWIAHHYIGYGHQSIGDCGTTTAYVEGVSMLDAKAVQDWPLYSGQEASTRYMDFSEAVFFNPCGNEAGRQILEAWRDFYLGAQEPVRAHLREKYPRQEGEEEKVYDRAINARSFDILRGFLPAGAATNLSWHTNLRQAADHLRWLLYHPNPQSAKLAQELHAQLREKYPHSFTTREESAEVKAYRQNVMEHHLLTSHLFTLQRKVVLDADLNDLCDLDPAISLMLCERPKGVELPWFLAEVGYVTSEFFLDFGSFRDLQRHRNGVVRMPLLQPHTFHHWYLEELPPALQEDAKRLLTAQKDAIERLDASVVVRQAYIAMGYTVPCRVTQPLPGFIYRMELRSSKTVHPTLREIVLEEIRQFRDQAPEIALHVDEDPDSWTIRRGKQTIEER